MQNNASILVVEDEPWIAMDLMMAVEDAGGEAVGPAASVEEAFALIEARPVAGAILDVNLTDRDVTPLVEYFMALGIPLILQTGGGLPAGLENRFPALIFHIKPCSAATLVAQLAELISAQRANGQTVGGTECEQPRDPIAGEALDGRQA